MGLAPNLRLIGVDVDFHRTKEKRVITIKKRVKEPESLASPTSSHRESEANRGEVSRDIAAADDALSDAPLACIPQKKKRNDLGDADDADSSPVSSEPPGR